MKKLLLLIILVLSCEGLTEVQDCKGVVGGEASIDGCGVCTGGTTELTPNYLQDCAGVCGGASEPDCAGACQGNATLDNCGVCDTNQDNNCTVDCLGVWNGTAVLDSCGVCGGDDSLCEDCNNASGGLNVLDCFGVCGGEATLDTCGVCTGGTTGLEVDYLKDLCGVCGGDGSTCVDCADVVSGEASIDDCGMCTGGTTGYDTNYLKDVCGICEGDGTTCLEEIFFDSGDISVTFNYTQADIEEKYYLSWSHYISSDSVDYYSVGDSSKISVYKGYALVFEFEDWFVKGWESETQNSGSENITIGSWGTGENFRFKITDNLNNYGYSDAFSIVDFDSNNDLAILQKIIELNNIYQTDVPYMQPTDLGTQYWTEGRLTSLVITDSYTSSQIDTLPENFGDLSMLTKFELEGGSYGSSWYEEQNETNLKYLPESIGNLTQLTELTIRNTDIETLPESIGNLSSLSSLIITDTHLETLPESFSNLNVSTLNLSNNELTEFPFATMQGGYISSSNEIDLRYNNLTSIPETVARCELSNNYYDLFKLAGNNICPPYPDCLMSEIGSLVKKWNNTYNSSVSSGQNVTDCEMDEYEFISTNTCTSNGEDCSDQYGYYSVDVDFLNDLGISVYNTDSNGNEQQFGSWSGGRLVGFSLNYFSNVIPESIGNLEFLNTIDIQGSYDWSDDEYVGITSIPESIGNLKWLRYINIYRHSLTTLPESIGDLDLKELHIQYGYLTTLTESVCNIPNLYELYLTSNELTSLPSCICDMWSLNPSASRIRISGNNICGSNQIQCSHTNSSGTEYDWLDADDWNNNSYYSQDCP